MAEGSSGHHPGGNRRPHRTGHHQLHNLSFQPMIEESFPLFTADEEVASERELLKSVEDGPYMQEVKYIIIHCSATRENRDFTVEDLLRCHRQRKFRTIGYHFYIRRSGIITQHVTRNFAASLFRNIKYFTLRKLYLCRKWMQKRLQKTIKTGITLPNFDFLA